MLSAVLGLGMLAGCGAQEKLPSEAYSKEAAEALALEIANAVMVYDLKTIMEKTALEPEAVEPIIADYLSYDEEGNLLLKEEKFDNLKDYLLVLDGQISREFQTLEIEAVNSRIMDIEDAGVVIDRAHFQEGRNREAGKLEHFQKENSKLTFLRVAKVELQLCFQEAEKTDADGNPVQQPRREGTMEVVLVWEDGAWRSFSPSLFGMFPSGTHFRRYIAEDR